MLCWKVNQSLLWARQPYYPKSISGTRIIWECFLSIPFWGMTGNELVVAYLKYSNFGRGAEARVQWVIVLSCTWLTWAQTLAFHIDLLSLDLPWVNHELKSRNKPWSLLGMAPNQEYKIYCINFGYVCSHTIRRHIDYFFQENSSKLFTLYSAMALYILLELVILKPAGN